MTEVTSKQHHATGPAIVGGRLAERPGLPGRWHAPTVSLVAAFMTLLDVSIVNVALPRRRPHRGRRPQVAGGRPRRSLA
jgi:hypothetical protein